MIVHGSEKGKSAGKGSGVHVLACLLYLQNKTGENTHLLEEVQEPWRRLPVAYRLSHVP